MSSMKNAIRVLGRHTIDMRTATGKWLTARCEEYASDLGGDDALSQQQRTIVSLVVFDELVLQSGQAWLNAAGRAGEREAPGVPAGRARADAARGVDRAEAVDAGPRDLMPNRGPPEKHREWQRQALRPRPGHLLAPDL